MLNEKKFQVEKKHQLQKSVDGSDAAQLLKK